MKDRFDAVAAKLADNEIALAELYATFARTFSEDASFWTALVDDERRHASLINDVRQSEPSGGVRPPPAGARPEAIDTMMRYVRSIVERCRKGELSRVQACALAKDLENSMLENKLFVVLGTGSAELTAVQERLAADTADHRRRIDETLARLRS